MIIKYPKHLLSQHELRRMVFYDPDTGIMTWLASCGVWTNGRRVGWISSKGYRRAMIGQVAYPFTHLVWLYVTGAWPEREIDH